MLHRSGRVCKVVSDCRRTGEGAPVGDLPKQLASFPPSFSIDILPESFPVSEKAGRKSEIVPTPTAFLPVLHHSVDMFSYINISETAAECLNGSWIV